MKTNFKKNVSVDAHLVLAAMKGGVHGMANAAYLMRDEFPGGPDEALKRCEWFKKQDEKYIKEVCDKVAEMEAA